MVGNRTKSYAYNCIQVVYEPYAAFFGKTLCNRGCIGRGRKNFIRTKQEAKEIVNNYLLSQMPRTCRGAPYFCIIHFAKEKRRFLASLLFSSDTIYGVS